MTSLSMKREPSERLNLSTHTGTVRKGLLSISRASQEQRVVFRAVEGFDTFWSVRENLEGKRVNLKAPDPLDNYGFWNNLDFWITDNNVYLLTDWFESPPTQTTVMKMEVSEDD